MNYGELIQNITTNIATNGQQAITAQVLQDVLVAMVQEMGQAGGLIWGAVDTSFEPDDSDSQLVYFAEGPGTYTHFNNAVVNAGEFAMFAYTNNAWQKWSVNVVEIVNSLNSTASDKALSAAQGKVLHDALAQAVQDINTALADKADTATVNAALANKADTSYVNAQLANKADTATVNAALANKADVSALAGKADKVAGAVAGNMASLDASGNLVDSGVPASAVGDVADKIDKVHDAEVGNVPMFKADGGIEDSGIPADNVAEQDGYYETMVVGGAENLIGSDIVASQFIRRKTGGSSDVGTGVAILKTIKGNTLVWNQQVQNADFSDGATGWNSTRGNISVADGICTVTCNSAGTVFLNRGALEGVFKDNVSHTYLLAARVKPSVTHNMGFANKNSIFATTSCTGGQWSVISTIKANYQPTTNDERCACVVGQNLALNDSYDVDWFIVIDLTQMFGSGNEPSTAAEFEALFPLNYYAYNTGSLLNLTATGLQTNGFNQWDEEWEMGAYNNSGDPAPTTINIRGKNPIRVFPSTQYYVANTGAVGFPRVFYYDIDGNYISRDAFSQKAKLVTTPANCAYMRFFMADTYGTTYNHDICINLSDVNKNGTYEPYWTETKALPITTATSGGVAIFSDGMKSVEATYDEMTATKATKRIGFVDLGDYNYSYQAPNSSYPYGYFSTTIADKKGGNTNLLCAKYETKANWVTDKNVRGGGSTTIYIIDSSYTNAATFKAAMAGVKLYYELATPTEYTLDTPFNTQYRVDNDGTETILPENTSTPTTSPFVADINYALNAIDTIRNLPQNYISKASMDAILTAFKTAGVITGYTLTWDATNQKYNCTITP